MKRIQLAVCAFGLALAGVISVHAAEEARLEGKAIVRAVHGQVTYQENGSWMPLKNNAELRAGVTIRTGPDSTADIQINGKSAVRVTADTTMQIPNMTYTGSRREGDTDTMLDLKTGSILGNVKKLSANSRYEIKTPHGVAGIRGTDFEVTVTPDNAGRFTVTFTSVTGQVIVSAVVEGNTVVKILHTGESWTPGDGDVRPTPVQIIQEYRTIITAVTLFIETQGYQPPPIPIRGSPFPTGGPPQGESSQTTPQ
jgi:hypothetical protein